MSDGFGKIDRLKDTYRVHDSSRKQKKERKSGEEREFLEMLAESERNIEEFEQEKPKRQQTPNAPGKGMLKNLSSSVPPPAIETINGGDDKKPGGGESS